MFILKTIVNLNTEGKIQGTVVAVRKLHFKYVHNIL